MKCKRCPDEAAPGRKNCLAHLERDRARAAARQEAARASGRCLVCSRPASRGTLTRGGKTTPLRHCRQHLAYYRDRSKA